MMQTRNLNIAPDYYFDLIVPDEPKAIGVKQ
jgi:hypothetical protein